MTNMNNKPTKEEMKQKENIQTGDLVSNNQNLDTILQEAEICEENALYDYELMCKEEDLRYKDIEKEI